MLNSSNPTQRNLSEEDSSGSDAGSEVCFGSVAAETDRFGFILANGSTTGVGPPPELVRQREAKWINIISQWDRILLKKKNKVKEQCQKGIPASLRAKCWPLLCGAADRMKNNQDLYKTLDSQPALQSWVDVIERDLDRQFPLHEMFLSRDGHGQRGLFRVLKAFTQYQPDEGYCQAQGPVAAVLLMNMPTEEAFWCLVQISEQYLPGYYSPLLEGVLFDAAMLTWVLKRACPAIHRHLQRHGVEPLMFATDWLMCLFTRHLPFNTLLRVWDLFFCYGVQVLFQVAVVLVRRALGRAEQREECEGQMETLERLRGVREQVQQEDDNFIAEVCSVPLSKKDLKRQTEKELEKWRKGHPSSTFDPRGRCHGYRMALARARESKEEQDRREREKGNLSVPLVRSASTLSLSPSLLRKWRRGGKADTGEWEGGAKVQRNFSMGAREKGRESWMGSSPKRVQRVEEEEDKVLEEHREMTLTRATEQKEHLNVPKELAENQSEPTDDLEETKELKEEEEIKQVEHKEPENSQPSETEESQGSAEVPQQDTAHCDKEDKTSETESTQDAVKAQCAGEVIQHSEETSHQEPSTHKQEEELDCHSQSQDLEQQSHNGKNQGQEVENRYTVETQEEIDKQAAESENTVVISENQTEIKKDADIDTNTHVEPQAVVDLCKEPIKQVDIQTEEETIIENTQQIEMHANIDIRMESDTEIQTSVETGQGSQLDRDVKAITVKDSDPTEETKMQQEPDETIQTEQGSQAVTLVVINKDTDALAETEMKVEFHTQTKRESNPLAETQEQGEVDTGLQEEVDTGTQTEVENGLELHEGVSSVKEITTEAKTSVVTECEPKEEVEFVVNTTTESMTKPTACTETDSEIHAADSTTQSDETLDEGSEEECEVVLPEPGQTKEDIVLAVDTETKVEEDTSTCDQTQTEDTPIEMQTHLENTDCTAPPEKTQSSTEPAEPAEPSPTAEPDGKGVTLNTWSPEQPAAEELTSQVTIGPVETKQMMENVTEKVGGTEDMSTPNQTVLPNIPQPMPELEHCTVDGPSNVSVPQLQNNDDSHLPNEPLALCNPGMTQVVVQRIRTSSIDFCVRKSASSHGSRLARRLSEDLFVAPQQNIQSQSTSSHADQSKDNASPSNPIPINSNQTPLDTTHSGASSHQPNEELILSDSKEVTGKNEGTMALQKGAEQEQRPPGTPKRLGLFRRLRGEQPKQPKAKGAPKIQVPKILIQDFSEGVGKERTIEEEGEEKLSSRERRRRRREQERKEKEEEKLRKKREKELEKERERERRKPQTRGKSFQVQRDRGSGDAPPPGNSGSQTLVSKRHSTVPYAESYF
ncbi:uncharacterized protein tbc1d10c isoform 2-T2 [Polymixia lowei]